MKKRILSAALAAVILLMSLSGCKDSSTQSSTVQVDYNAQEEVAKYKDYLGELSDADKNYTIELGYNDCDHMIASLIGQGSGIFDALGLKVNITKTGQVIQAMAAGEMDAGYQGIWSAINAVNNGAPLFMAAANHLGGSYYLVVSNDIKEPKDLIGKKLAIGSEPWTSPEWCGWAEKLGLPVMPEGNFEAVEMSATDALIAMKAGQIDAFATCDPFASQAEFEGIGHVMATDWGFKGSKLGKDLDGNVIDNWGICCVYAMSNNFKEAHPELAKRLVLAHTLSVQYIYQHPYNAAMIFADGFGTKPEVALNTIYMKTVKEGRTLTWQFSEKNLENYIANYEQYDTISEGDQPGINDITKFMSDDLLSSCGAKDFNTFINEQVEPLYPTGISFEDWLKKAKEIDGVETSEYDDAANIMMND